MAAIPTAQQLSDANLDSLERLVVALGLYFSQQLGSLPSTSTVKDGVKVSLSQRSVFNQETLETEEKATINFVCKFKLAADTQTDGGELLSNTEEFLTGVSAPVFAVTPPSLELVPALPAIPETLTSAEQLLVWALLTFSISTHPNSRNYIQIDPRYADNELRINYQIPLDRQALGLSGFALIAGVQRVTQSYTELNSGAVSQIPFDSYEIAVEEGFIGTRAEWLASLIGPQGEPGDSGYTVAQQLGFVGTEQEWLESLVGPVGPQGPAGLDGKDAYQQAVENGFIGSEAEWVASFGPVGINMGEWDSAPEFTTGIRFDASTAKVFFPVTDTETRLGTVPQPGEVLYDEEAQRLYFGNGLTAGGLSIQSQADLDIDWDTAFVGAYLMWDGTRLTFGDPLEGFGLGSVALPLAVTSFSVYPTEVNEADETPITFRVGLSKASSQPTAVSYTLSGLLTEEQGLLIIPVGATYGEVVVTPVNDNVDNTQDTITMVLRGAYNNEIEIPYPAEPVSAKVIDDEDDGGADPAFEVPVILSVSPSTTLEAGGAPLVFTVTIAEDQLEPPGELPTLATTVTYTLSGTAVEGTDYPAIPEKSVVIPGGQASAAVTITPLNNQDSSDDKTVTMTLTGSAITGTPPNLHEATATIEDVVLAVNAPTVSPSSIGEGSGSPLVFTVSQTKVSSLNTTITYSLTGTAVEGTDYSSIAQKTVIIPAGQTSATVEVSPLNNDNDEPNRTVIFTVTGANNGGVIGFSATPATGTITDDDIALSIATPTVSPSSVSEAGGVLTFTLTQNRVSVNSTTVTYTLSGTAVEGTDYTSIANKTVTIPAGQTTGTVTVTALDDVEIVDGNKTVILTVIGAVNNGGSVTYSGTAVTGTITDNDVALSIATPTVSPASVSEAGGTLTFTLTQNWVSVNSTTITYSLSGTAVEGTDYTSIANKTVIIPAGQTTGTVTVTALDDGEIVDGNKTVILTVIGAVNNGGSVTYSGTAVTGTITDNDVALSIATPTVSPASVSEAGGVLTFTLTQNRASVYDTTITYSLTGTAVEGTDYQSIAQKTVTIPAGQTTGTVTVTALDDVEIVDGNKTVILTVIGAVNNGASVTYSGTAVTGTITDNDVALSIATPTVSPASVSEAGGVLTFTLTQNRVSVNPTTITYSLSGTAVEGTDYTSIANKTVTIPAGQTTGTVTVTALDDGEIVDGNKTVILTVIGAVNNGQSVTYSATPATGTITDDELSSTISGLNVYASRRSYGYYEYFKGTYIPDAFTISQTKVISVDTQVTVSFLNTNGALGDRATEGTDFEAINKTVTIPAGQTSTSISISTIASGGNTLEKDLCLSIANATVLGSYVPRDGDIDSLTIRGLNVMLKQFSVNSTLLHSNASVNLSVTTQTINHQPITVFFTFGGTAVKGTDYDYEGSASLVIAAGEWIGYKAIQRLQPTNQGKTIIVTFSSASTANTTVADPGFGSITIYV